jgi:hypothetical protein
VTTLGIRWTVGDVSPHGFQALQLAAWGAWHMFGERARYVICTNTIAPSDARHCLGVLPPAVELRAVERSDVPAFIAEALDAAFAQGVGWKFAPLRIFPELRELALDNDCILWSIPSAIDAWLSDAEPSAVIAEDVRPCFGRFAALVGDDAPRNSGIRGLPAHFDLAAALRDILAIQPGVMTSELDEQGLQVAALVRSLTTRVVDTGSVSICSPFWPHSPALGRHGAHFVGLNAKQLPWSYEGRPATELTREHFARHRDEIARRVGVPRLVPVA